MTPEEAKALRAENKRLRKVLATIRDWEVKEAYLVEGAYEGMKILAAETLADEDAR